MTRLKVKKSLIGQEIFINHSLTLVFTDYMSDSDYKYAVKNYPKYFEKPKKVKKNDTNK